MQISLGGWKGLLFIFILLTINRININLLSTFLINQMFNDCSCNPAEGRYKNNSISPIVNLRLPLNSFQLEYNVLMLINQKTFFV